MVDKMTDYICKKCHNTGKNLRTSQTCGCVEGEKILITEQKLPKENYVERLATNLVKSGIVTPSLWVARNDFVIRAIEKALEDTEKELLFNCLASLD